MNNENRTTKLLKSQRPASPKMIVADDLANLFNRIQDFIAYRAYELYERRGRNDGHELEDWFQAEAEISIPVNEEIKQSGEKILLRAPMPGFTAQDTEVGVAPDRVIIWAKRRTKNLEAKETPDARMTEESVTLLKAIPLPTTVDPSRAVASFSNESLMLELPKTG